MGEILWFWLAITGAACLVWTSRHLQLSAAQRLMPPLDSGMFARSTRPLPAVTWLVAAKDEADNIEACLRSLAGQDYPDLRIIAVNDRSTDGTGPIMDRLAAEHPRVSVVHVSALRDGWFGKNNAMREGVAQATGPWLCFTDADCVQVSPRSLAVAMHYALEKSVDFLSVLPAHETKSFWEGVVQPACSGIMMIWFNPMRVNDPKRRTAYANGAFMLMTRACYDAIGGHDAVKTQLNEDMHMARLAKEAGLRLAVVSNVDLYTVRMYDRFAQIRAGWSRIFYGCFGTMRRLAVTALVVAVFSLLPWAALAASVTATAIGWARWSGWPLLAGLSGLTCLVQQTVMFRFYRMNRLKAWYALAYPIGAAVGLWALFGSMRRAAGSGSITWRGTTYREGRVDPVPQRGLAPP